MNQGIELMNKSGPTHAATRASGSAFKFVRIVSLRGSAHRVSTIRIWLCILFVVHWVNSNAMTIPLIASPMV